MENCYGPTIPNPLHIDTRRTVFKEVRASFSDFVRRPRFIKLIVGIGDISRVGFGDGAPWSIIHTNCW